MRDLPTDGSRVLAFPKSMRPCSASPSTGLMYTGVSQERSWTRMPPMSTPREPRMRSISLPNGSSPTTPKAETRVTPMATRLFTTLPAPPRE